MTSMSSAGPSLQNEWLKHAPPPRPLGPGEKWNVFLSYRSINRAWVLNLYDVLCQHGHHVFIDQCALKPGDELLLRLQDALQASQAGVLIWSDAATESDWVLKEYATLEGLSEKKKGFQFIPISLDGSEVPLFAGNRIHLDFRTYPDGPNGGELMRLLHAVVGQTLSFESAKFADEQDEEARRAGAEIAAAVHRGNADRLVHLAEQADIVWVTSPVLASKAAEGLLSLGKNDAAVLLLKGICKRFPRAVRPKQLYASALLRRAEGTDLDDAQEILGVLYEEGQRDSETVLFYARSWMDSYVKSNNGFELKRSRDLYVEAFNRAPDDYATGINAAAKSVLMGSAEDLKAAEVYAARVEQIVGNKPHPNDYWKTAAVGLVFLIRRDYVAAARIFDEAVSMAPKEIGSHQSTWTQVYRLVEKLQPTINERATVRSTFLHLPDPPS
jgi:tetratricopeptide (TPR) repeat protein